MKRLALLVLFAIAFAFSAGAQSLADIAAKSRAKQKSNPNVQVIDNDILPSVSDPSEFPSPYEPKKDESEDKDKTADKDKNAPK